MIKVGVISDTHLRKIEAKFLDIIEKYLKDVDVIIHAGDLTTIKILDAFKGKTVYAVHGNMDDSETQRALPDKLVFEIEGHKIGLIHGWGPPFGFPDKVLKEFKNEKIDCLVYGHSHIPKCEEKKNVLTINPGALFPSFFSRQGSLGYLYIKKGEKIKGEVIKI